MLIGGVLGIVEPPTVTKQVVDSFERDCQDNERSGHLLVLMKSSKSIRFHSLYSFDAQTNVVGF